MGHRTLICHPVSFPRYSLFDRKVWERDISCGMRLPVSNPILYLTSIGWLGFFCLPRIQHSLRFTTSAYYQALVRWILYRYQSPVINLASELLRHTCSSHRSHRQWRTRTRTSRSAGIYLDFGFLRLGRLSYGMESLLQEFAICSNRSS